MSNGLKAKKSKEEKEDKDFKFADHLQNDPLEIVKLFVGKDISKEIPLKKINTIVSLIYPEPKLKVKKVKKSYLDSPGLGGWNPGTVFAATPTWNTTPNHIADVDFEEDSEFPQINDDDAEDLLDSMNEVEPIPTILDTYLKMARGGRKKEETKPQEPLTMRQSLKEDYNIFKYNYGGGPALIKGYVIEGKYYSDDEDIENFFKERTVQSVNFSRIKTVCKVFKLTDDAILSKYVIKFTPKVQVVNKSNIYMPILPILVRLKLIDFKNSNSFALKEDHKKLREDLFNKDLWDLNWKLENVGIVRQKTKLTTYVVSIEDPESKEEVKFVYTDCDFRNPSGKGYNIPIDKSITTRSIVEVKKDKLHKYGFKEGEDTESQVIRIKPAPSSKKLFFGSNTRRKDVIKIKLLSNGKGASVYAEDLKFIRSKQEDYVNSKKEEGAKYHSGYQTITNGDIEAFFQTNPQWATQATTIHP